MSVLVLIILLQVSVAGADATDEGTRSGGDFTVFDATSRAYGQPSPTVAIRDLGKFAAGNRLFNTNWVIAPASVASLDGLGPLFNRVSCSSCHTRDGRGIAPESPNQPMSSMLVRLSVGSESPQPHPVYGDQLNDHAIPGVEAEGSAIVRWQEVTGRYADGSPYLLRKPLIEFVDLAYGDLGPEVMLSARLSPAVFGLGLLDAVGSDEILLFADPDDSDGDGISGRPNYVVDVSTGERVLGRFGWKANTPSLRQQVAAAARGDIGLTSSLFPDHGLSSIQTAALAAPDGEDGAGYELSDEQLDKIVFYLQSLAVPARRDTGATAGVRGEILFEQAKCTGCHRPTLVTGSYPSRPELSNQTVRPYSDLLLHDMGEGLADGRPDFEAGGSEWRTPPLWGLGLIETVRNNSRGPAGRENLALLHDGRARTVEEAILWHDGEAAESKTAFLNMSAEDRAALVAFLKSV